MAGGSVGSVTYRYYPLGIAFTPVPHCSDTRRTPFPLLVADGLQWKGERGQANCENGGSATDPGAGNILRLICRV